MGLCESMDVTAVGKGLHQWPGIILPSLIWGVFAVHSIYHYAWQVVTDKAGILDSATDKGKSA